MKTIQAFNYFKTINQKSVTPIYTEVEVKEVYCGVTIGKTYFSEVLVIDGIIVSEKVKQTRYAVDLYLNADSISYFNRTRIIETLEKAKSFLDARIHCY